MNTFQLTMTIEYQSLYTVSILIEKNNNLNKFFILTQTEILAKEVIHIRSVHELMLHTIQIDCCYINILHFLLKVTMLWVLSINEISINKTSCLIGVTNLFDAKLQSTDS